MLGTASYMSPEQAEGKKIDTRSDIFSLGVILYEMLAGERPFKGKSPVETLHAIISVPAPPLTDQAPELNEILDKALAKDAEDRYQHAGDFILDLKRFMRKAPGATPASSTGKQAPIMLAARTESSDSRRPWKRAFNRSLKTV